MHFFTPVSYENQPKSTSKAVLEAVDHYFYLGGRKAYIIAGRTDHRTEGVVLAAGTSSLLLSALKVSSYFTVVMPLLALVAKAALRCKHQFHLIDPKAELERGVEIAPHIVAQIQELLPAIERREAHPQIQWLSTRGATRVFRLAEAPHLVFKLSLDPNAMGYRFKNMVKGKEVCLAHQLDSLVIPQARLFELETVDAVYPVIAEQSLNIRAAASAQEALYQTHADRLERAVGQLSTFIAQTGFSDVALRNIPVVEEALPSPDALRVGLIDLEHAEGAKEGILGDRTNDSCGLAGCLFSEKQIDAVLGDATQRGIITQEEARQSKIKRMGEIRSAMPLTAFYRKHGILENPRKPLVVDLDTLGLDLSAQSGPVTMRQVAEETIAEINRLMQETGEDESVKGKRYVLLNMNTGALTPYSTLGGPSRLLMSDEEEKSFWLRRIIDALVAKEHLFQLVKVNGHGYYIQA